MAELLGRPLLAARPRPSYPLHRGSSSLLKMQTVAFTSPLNLECFLLTSGNVAALVSFRVGRERGVLEDALRVLGERGSGRDRVREWLRMYEERDGRWVPALRAPARPGA